MRINKFVARASGLSRRAVDKAVAANRILINNQSAKIGQDILPTDKVELDGKILHIPDQYTTIMLNKPVNFVVSRTGQGSQTIYELLPKELHKFKPIGRLDKDSSGLLLLTDDGEMANVLTHPKFFKQKIYEVFLNKPLTADHKIKIEQGVILADGLSKVQLNGQDKKWIVTLSEGRNRQIRRTFDELNYKVTELRRISFGKYKLGDLELGKYKVVNSDKT
jgi:23S rRNA pseudouridine2605 synthase